MYALRLINNRYNLCSVAQIEAGFVKKGKKNRMRSIR